MKPCVLHVRDEVNVKIEGLDLDTGNKPPLDSLDQIIKEDQSNDGDSKE